MIPWLRAADPFPPVERALEEPNGLLAAGADLSIERLLEAYRNGIFPWYSEGQPVLWWSPDPRMVLFPGELRITRSLRKRLAKRDYEVRADTAFEEVIRACAAPRPGQDGTWITPEMEKAYIRLHKEGFAHSVESWLEGELAGGIYGVSLGRCFFGESMFSHKSNGSKVALARLIERLKAWDFHLLDAQVATRHMMSLGAKEIPRAAFLKRLKEALRSATIQGKWPAQL